MVTHLSSTHSIPILSPYPSPLEDDAAAEPNGSASAAGERKGTGANDAYKIYEEIIKDNIEYDHLMQYSTLDKDRLNEILDLILETVCSARKTIRIAGDDYPAELVKAKFMKLNSSHIEFALDCMRENTTKIRNIKQYLRVVLSMPRPPLTTTTPPLSLTIWQVAKSKGGRPDETGSFDF